MTTLLALLVLFCFMLLLIGFFSPATSLFWFKGIKTRKKSSLIYGTALIVFFVSFGALTDKQEISKESINKATVGNSAQQQVEDENKPEDLKESVEAQEESYKIGDAIIAGKFIYKVNKYQFLKSVGDEFSGQTADGIYLLINLTIKNTDNEPHTLDNSFFKLTDEKNISYETSSEAEVALEMTKNETLLLKQFNPNIVKTGSLIFEVPQKKAYNLHLSGGFWSNKENVVRLVP